jgi:hypothetical protein
MLFLLQGKFRPSCLSDRHIPSPSLPSVIAQIVTCPDSANASEKNDAPDLIIEKQQAYIYQPVPLIEMTPTPDDTPAATEALDLQDFGNGRSCPFENAPLTPLETNISKAEHLSSSRPEEYGDIGTRHKERGLLLQTSLSSTSETACTTACQLNRRERPRVSAQRERSILFIFKLWWRECALILFAVGVLIAVAVILQLNKQRPQPSWGWGLNLNTLIAVLATLLRSSLVTVIEEGK